MTHFDAFADAPLAQQPVLEGDVIILGPNGLLAFEVMAVRGEKAWVRDIDGGRDGVVDLTAFRRFGLEVAGAVQ